MAGCTLFTHYRSAIPSLDVIAPLAHMDFSNSLITDMLVSNIETGQGALSSFTPLCADGSALSSMTLDQVYPGIVGSSLEHTAHLPDSFGWDVEIDHSGINQDDWRLWKPGSTVALPPLAKHSMENLLRVMKTWPKMLTKGFQAPPMFHYTHVFPNHTATSIANCITLAKAWVHQTDGDNGRIQEAIRQEMTMDEPSLLSAIQAMVIYTIMIIFPASNQSAVCLVDPAIFLCLQKAVPYVASTGLMTTEETENRLPSWECWVHVTAKRRALLSLYLLHWSYSVYHGLESFACSQLGFMPAPAAKFLWQSKSVNEWENLYSMWLAQWGDHPYTMRDFATIEASTNLDERAQIWLEDTDELGMLFFSIGRFIHPVYKCPLEVSHIYSQCDRSRRTALELRSWDYSNNIRNVQHEPFFSLESWSRKLCSIIRCCRIFGFGLKLGRFLKVCSWSWEKVWVEEIPVRTTVMITIPKLVHRLKEIYERTMFHPQSGSGPGLAIKNAAEIVLRGFMNDNKGSGVYGKAEKEMYNMMNEHFHGNKELLTELAPGQHLSIWFSATPETHGLTGTVMSLLSIARD
ncbi:hypothetical protein IG631_09638 [Alternaria alternata]|nr:hypothetical protein IG631_09638 [Alternaria alternata]